MLLGLKKGDELSWEFGVFNVRNRVFIQHVPYEVIGLRATEKSEEIAVLTVLMKKDNRNFTVEYPKHKEGKDLRHTDLVFRWRDKIKPELAYCLKNFYKQKNS